MTSIRARLTLGLGLIILFFVAQAALVWWGQDNARRDVVETTRKNTLASSQLGDLAVWAQQVRRYEKEYFVFVGNRERRESYVKDWENTAKKINKQIALMRTNADNAFSNDDIAAIDTWEKAAEFYSSEMRKVFDTVNAQASRVAAASSIQPEALSVKPDLKAADKAAAPTVAPQPVVMITPAEANTLIGAGKDRFSGVLIKGVSEMAVVKTKETLGLADLAASRFNQLLWAVLATVAVGVVVALALIVTLPKTVSNAVAELTQAVDEISKGKVDQKINVANIAEFAGLSQSLERLRLGQQALIARLRR